MNEKFFWLALIVFFSYTTQAMSGFGSTILALTLGIHLYPIEVLLPVLVPLDMMVNLYLGFLSLLFCCLPDFPSALDKAGP